jgi:hypothetical protein
MARVTHDVSIQRDKCLSAYRLQMQTRPAGPQMDGHADTDYSLRWKGNGVPSAIGVVRAGMHRQVSHVQVCSRNETASS